MPGVVKLICKLEDPVVQKSVFKGKPLSFPRIPDKIFHPVEGDIDHKLFPFVQGAEPDEGTINPPKPLLVIVTTVFWHTVSFGEIVKLGIAFCDILIPLIVPEVSLHGFVNV